METQVIMDVVYSTEILHFKKRGKPTKYWQGHVLRYDVWWYCQTSCWFGSNSEVTRFKPTEAACETDARFKIQEIMDKQISKGYVPEKKLESIKFEINFSTIDNIIRQNNPECYEGMDDAEMVKDWLECVIQGGITFENNKLELTGIKEIE